MCLSFKPSELQAVLGRTFRKQNSSSEQIFKIEKFWVHQDFDKETFDNDIGKHMNLLEDIHTYIKYFDIK